MILVSYYTSSYQERAQELAKSADMVGLDHDIIELPDLGSWRENVLRKPGFLMMMLDAHHKENILWVDADAVIHKYPDWSNLGWLGLYYNKPEEPWAGTIFLNNSDPTRGFLDRWIDFNETMEPSMDQDTLQYAVTASRIVVRRLPPAYHWVERVHRKRFPGADPIIEHFMDSRS